MNDDREWLDALKAGDPVVVCGGGFRDHFAAAKVDRATRTMLVVGQRRFRRADGREVGGTSFYNQRITQPTPDLMDRIKRARLAASIQRAVEGVSKSKLPIATLEAIRAALQPLVDERAVSLPGDER